MNESLKYLFQHALPDVDVGRNHSASVSNPSDEVKLSSAMENFDIAVCRT